MFDKNLENKEVFLETKKLGEEFCFEANVSGSWNEDGTVFFNNKGLEQYIFGNVDDFFKHLDGEDVPHQVQYYMGSRDDDGNIDCKEGYSEKDKIDEKEDGSSVYTVWKDVNNNKIPTYDAWQNTDSIIIPLIQTDRLAAETFYAFADKEKRKNTMDQEGYEIEYGEGYIFAPIKVNSLPSLETVIKKAEEIGIDEELSLNFMERYYSLIANSGKEAVLVYYDDNISIGHHTLDDPIIKEKLSFETIEEGKDKIVSLYAAKSETTGGEFADSLAEHVKDEFDAAIPLPIVMGAIQAFREWDCEDGNEILAEVHMLHIGEDGFGGEPYWDNDFQDYMFEDGSFVIQGTRVGVEVDNKLVLDKGIFFASAARRGEDGNE